MMNQQQNVFAPGFCAGYTPHLTGTHLIDESHSSQYARLTHTHNEEMEIYYVYGGAGQYMVDGNSYFVAQGDIVICNAQTLHGEDPAQQRRMRSYSFAMTDVRIEGLPENHLIDSRTDPVLHCGELADLLAQVMRLIFLLFTDQHNLKQVCTLMAQSVLLLTYDMIQSRKRNNQGHIEETVDNVLAQRISRYLDQHYHEALTLTFIAEALHVSSDYISHTFKTAFNMPPMQYITKRRIGEAQTLLMDTQIPIADIADRLGFGSPWNFTSVFKKWVGIPPSEYRRTFQEMNQWR